MTTPVRPKQALISIPEACAYLGGIHRVTLYRRIREGHLKLVHIGSRSFISTAELDSYIEKLGA